MIIIIIIIITIIIIIIMEIMTVSVLLKCNLKHVWYQLIHSYYICSQFMVTTETPQLRLNK